MYDMWYKIFKIRNTIYTIYNKWYDIWYNDMWYVFMIYDILCVIWYIIYDNWYLIFDIW